jgi:hypothetical protein
MLNERWIRCTPSTVILDSSGLLTVTAKADSGATIAEPRKAETARIIAVAIHFLFDVAAISRVAAVMVPKGSNISPSRARAAAGSAVDASLQRVDPRNHSTPAGDESGG